MELLKRIKIKFIFKVREIIGFFRYLKSKKSYKSSNNQVFCSDFSENSLTIKKDESFKSFFLRVEKARGIKSNRVAKNVKSSLVYFSNAAKFIPFLIKYCNLKNTHKVLDYGSGGLRCGFGLLEFLETSSYSCADITDKFLKEAKLNSDLLNYLYINKKGNFYQIGNDTIPNNYYDLVISIYVVCHIPKKELEDYFSSINKFLKIGGKFYFDFIPAPFHLIQNSITYTYPYRIILKNLERFGFKIENTIGFGIIAIKISNL